MATTANPCSTSVSTSTPVGRSIATRSSAGGANLPRRVTNSVMPAALCANMNCATVAPRSSITHTACSRAAQSRPTKKRIETSLVPRPPTRGGLADLSLTGAPRRACRGATPCCRSRSPGLSEAAGLILAVERQGPKAVLGEAPEDLLLTLADLDRLREFSALTIGGCPSEGAGVPAPGRLRQQRRLDWPGAIREP